MVPDDRNMTGPFLCILACLFVLSLTASRSWDRTPAAGCQALGTVPATAEPSVLAQTTGSSKIPGQDHDPIGSQRVQAMAPVDLTDIPDVVAGRQAEPYDPGRFTQAVPSDRYAQPWSFVSLTPSQSQDAPPVDTPTPDTSTLARQVAPHEEVARAPVASTTTPVEPPIVEPPIVEPSIPVELQQIVASRPERAGSRLRTEPLPEPASEAVDAGPLESGPLTEALSQPRLGRPSFAAEESESAVVDTTTASGTWSEPKALFESLSQLADSSVASRWAAETARLLRDLGTAASDGPIGSGRVLPQLREKLDEAEPLAATMGDTAEATRLRRTAHALRRRLDVWQQVAAIDQLASSDGAGRDFSSQGDTEPLALVLAEIDAITANSAEGEAWRDYLMIDALHDLALRRESAKRGPAADRQTPRELAQQVFGRLTQTPVSVAQREFITSDPISKLRDRLQPWAAEPVPSSRLLAHLEQYEQTELESDARRLAADCLHLSLANDPLARELAGRLQTHYRNANLRVAITDVLLNRMIPAREPEYASVRDKVLDVTVRGKSMTSTDVAIRLLPDPQQIHLILEVQGRVATATYSTTGPVTFYNDGDAVYTARKPLEVDLNGIRPGPAQVRVSNDVRLRRMETEFDEIPLVGSLVQEVARGQHEMNHDAAKREIRNKMVAQTKRRTDLEADERFGKLSERLRDRIIDPLEALALDPTMIAAETTAERITMRLRLAGKDQLAAHTPRPRAPTGSLASVQVHQSAIHNLTNRMELAGNTFTLEELAEHIAARLDRPPFWEPDPTTEDVAITFAKNDPITIRLQEGHIEIGLSITRLRSGSRHWDDFQVLAFYRPEVDGRSIELVRDGVVQLIGKRMSMGTRIAVRGIFAKTFSKNRPWKITSETMVDHPKLADLCITQLVLEDGWLGVALGPDPAADPAAIRAAAIPITAVR